MSRLRPEDASDNVRRTLWTHLSKFAAVHPARWAGKCYRALSLASSIQIPTSLIASFTGVAVGFRRKARDYLEYLVGLHVWALEHGARLEESNILYGGRRVRLRRFVG